MNIIITTPENPFDSITVGDIQGQLLWIWISNGNNAPIPPDTLVRHIKSLNIPGWKEHIKSHIIQVWEDQHQPHQIALHLEL